MLTHNQNFIMRRAMARGKIFLEDLPKIVQVAFRFDGTYNQQMILLPYFSARNRHDLNICVDSGETATIWSSNIGLSLKV